MGIHKSVPLVLCLNYKNLFKLAAPCLDLYFHVWNLEVKEPTRLPAWRGRAAVH